MDTEHLNAIEAALRLHRQRMDATNRCLAAQMRAIPGATDALRRYLAMRGMSAEQIECLVKCEIPEGSLPALLEFVPTKN